MVAFASILAVTVRADEVTEWNQTMLRAGLVAQTSSLIMSRVAAIVQAAVFDAVNGIDRRYTPIHVSPAAPAGASRRAAAVQAAYVTLSDLYGTRGVATPTPLQVAQQATLDARLRVSLTVIAAQESAASITSGIAWGQTVADQIWAWRLTDGFATTTPTWPGNTSLGQWRPTPNAPAPGTSTLGAGYPQFVFMTPWAIETRSQFRPAGPPALSSARYAQDFNETKTIGSYSSTQRTADQTIYSLFWATGTAAYLWNHAAVSLIEDRDEDRDDGWSRDRDDRGRGDRHGTLLEHARVLATMDVAMADAAIGCWDAKYTYNFWRPITAIREVADDGNPLTTPDPTWTPMFATPAHPDYPSGHSCVSGAEGAVLANEFGEKTHFSIESDLMIGVTRNYRSFSEALEEVKNARVFAGIHFRTATEDGQKLGSDVAQYILEHSFQRAH
jgi:hypothetical protein